MLSNMEGKKMNSISETYQRLLGAETDGDLGTQARRVIGDERNGLHAVMSLLEEARGKLRAAQRILKQYPLRADDHRPAVNRAQAEVERLGARAHDLAVEAERVLGMWS